MTYPQPNQPIQPGPRNRRSGRGWFFVLGAAVLGVFVFCGIVVAVAGSKQPVDTRDVSRTGALGLPPATSAPATETPPVAGTTAAPTSEPATTPPATGTPAAPTTPPPATKAPTTKAPTTKPPTKKPTTKPPANANCNPNYSPCVPNDPVDVDCKGGSGNGPSYVQGPVRVIGSDVYGLDTDHDGIGCE